MKFFGRHNEIKELQETRNLSLQTARFTIVTGRRRSGKTSLLIKAYEDVQDMLYFFVARKSEAELCRDFIEEMTSKLQLPILGEVTRFADIFKTDGNVVLFAHAFALLTVRPPFRCGCGGSSRCRVRK